MTDWTVLSKNRSFRGEQYVFQFKSKELDSTTSIGVYLPDKDPNVKFPMLMFLSGLTCTERNFIEKANAQKYASKHRIILVNPDTSPRNVNIEGDKDSYDLGEGAGFYLDATEPKWAKHYRMYSYIINELIPLVQEKFPVDPTQMSIFGHSMGGHGRKLAAALLVTLFVCLGALVLGLRNPHLFRSISAFAPMCHPSNSLWGQKAFSNYLGASNKESWKQYDAFELAKVYSGPERQVLIDQGMDDQFYMDGQLQLETFEKLTNKNLDVTFWKRNCYDHSYFYIATFIEDHINFHVGNWRTPESKS